MENKSLIETLDALSKALEHKQENTQFNTVLNAKDQSEIAGKYLNGNALFSMGIRSKDLTVFDEVGKSYKTVYFAVRVKTSNIESGVKQMAEIANNLAEKGLTHSVLSPICSLELIRMPLEVSSSVVFFFPLVPVDKVEEVKKYHKFSTEEGDIGKALESFNADLAPGEFMAVTRITYFVFAENKSESFDVDGMLFSIVDQHLKLLPAGTKFLGANKCGITDLSVPYELKFFNPLMTRIKRVELNYARQFAEIDNMVKEFNLITGISYYDENGKKLFNYDNEEKVCQISPL